MNHHRPASPDLATRDNRPRCEWCDRPFTPRQTGGKPQTFHSVPCRRKFHKNLNKRALRLYRERQITIAQLQAEESDTEARARLTAHPVRGAKWRARKLPTEKPLYVK